ncbi:TPA: hypothetical protein N0F65_010431 [Lagenidium giganteum]|uniref:Uncharacterized protein n=1 Tax=Lagenidium giganteum TaxID=4803 RepID=A0AAV2YUM8_9STRA|nr:TPA: hypothetical protein N0F65_010431 [Lagenidium giganteum]
MAARRAGKSLSSSLYHDFLDEKTKFKESLEPADHSKHTAALHAVTPSGTKVGVQTQVISPFFKTAVKRGVASTLVMESQLNSMLTTCWRLSSERHLELQAHLQVNKALRFTLEAHESAADKMPTSFAKIGCDYKDERIFAGLKIDAVNGPTLEATAGGQLGVRGVGVSVGVIGAYDVGLDHSDRVGRFTTLNMATSVESDDLCGLLQINDKGRLVHFTLAQTVTPQLLVGSELLVDRRKDRKVLRLRSNYAMSDNETVSSSLGSDGILIGAYEWQTSKHLKTKVSAQMDVRHYDSDSHHLGVSIEIS